MFDRVLNAASRWALDHVGHDRVDYVVSNTMTGLNRRLLPYLWTYELKAVVEQVIDEAAQVKTFVLRPNQHWPGMLAGQHIELLVELGGRVQHRCYSPSARPDGRFSITVKRKPGGAVSEWLHTNVAVGDVLVLGKPRGRFTLGDQPKVLMLAAGSGITPIHSMVTQCLSSALAPSRDLKVMVQFRDAADIVFQADLRDWAAKGLPVTVSLSGSAAAADTSGQAVVGRLDASQIIRACPDVVERHVYLCGPNGFMQEMLIVLAEMGVPARNIHTERFELSAQAQPSASEIDLDGAEVVFEHINQTITLTSADQGKTLLQLANERGLHLEQGCGKGACGTCKLTMHEGQAAGNVLGSSVYLCTSFPASRTLVLGA